MLQYSDLEKMRSDIQKTISSEGRRSDEQFKTIRDEMKQHFFELRNEDKDIHKKVNELERQYYMSWGKITGMLVISGTLGSVLVATIFRYWIM